MVLPLKVRTTLAIDLKSLIYEEVLRYLPGFGIPKDRPDLEAYINDAEELSTLRAGAESLINNQASNLDQITALERYVEGLIALARLTNLASIPFPWSNSLSVSTAIAQNRGIHYEIINVLYNLAALYTVKAEQYKNSQAADCFRKSAGILKYMEINTVPLLEETPPPELEKTTLQFLHDFMLSKAAALCAVEAVDNWKASMRYKELEERASGIPLLSKEWQSYFQEENRSLAARACLDVAFVLARSRKRDDQLLRKGALMKCLELNRHGGPAKEAEMLLKQPLGRRSKSSLIDLEEVTAFFPSTYFAMSDATLPAEIPFSVNASRLFSRSVPVAWVNAPVALRQKVHCAVRTQISEQLLKLNSSTLFALAECNIPLSLECSMRPTAVPESLGSLLNDIRASLDYTLPAQIPPNSMNEKHTAGYQHPLLILCKEKLNQCDSLFSLTPFSSEIEAQLFRLKLEEGQTMIHKLEAFMSNHSELTELLIRSSQTFDGVSYPEPLLAFLGITTEAANKQKHKSKPMLMTKMKDLYEALRAEIKERSRYQIALEDRLASTNFINPILGHCHNPTGPTINSSNEDIQKLFEDCLELFAKDFVYLQAEKDKAKKRIRRIRDLHNQCLTYSRHWSRSDTKIKAAHSLITAAASLLAFSSGLKSCLWCIEPLLELLKEKSSKNAFLVPEKSCMDVKKHLITTDPHSVNLAWRPGQHIDICIK